MIKHIKKIAFLSLTLVATVASSVIAIEKPVVSVETYSINSLGLKKIDSMIYINIDNPNDIGLEIKKIDYKVDINTTKDVAEGVTKKIIKINKNTKKNIVEVPVSFDNLKTMYAVKSIMLDPEKINYSVKGTVYFQTLFGDLPIPFTKSSYIDNSDSIKKIKEQIKYLNPLNYF